MNEAIFLTGVLARLTASVIDAEEVPTMPPYMGMSKQPDAGHFEDGRCDVVQRAKVATSRKRNGSCYSKSIVACLNSQSHRIG